MNKFRTSILSTTAVCLFALLFSTGCTSYFKRQDCEATNWYEYGQKVALSGRRLSGDGFISDCRLVEAKIRESDLDNGFKQGMEKYCSPVQAFATGKSGETFSTEMCDGGTLRTLVAKHTAGVLEYCQRSNGFPAGAKGKTYNGICPKELEAAFIPEFNRGRKSYLTVLLNENERRIGEIDREISMLESQRNMKQFEAQNLLVPHMILERVYHPESGTYREQYVSAVSLEKQNAANSARSQAHQYESQIGRKRDEQSQLRSRSSNIRLDVVGLDTKGEG